VLAGWFSAYNPDFAAYSPGAIRMLRAIEYACDINIGYIDMARGDESFKKAMKTGDAFVGSGTLHRPSAGAVIYRATQAPKTALTAYVLEQPRVRAFVRSSLRKVGTVRERLGAATGPRT
jgi:CelD/BcsL family acetyltransferase involved in cellulose biosynthesis